MVTQAAIDGNVDADESAALEAQKVKTIAAIEAVSKAYSEATGGEIDMDMVDEGAFCLSFCSYGRISIEFVDTLKKMETNTEVAPPDVLSFFRVPIWDKVYRNMILRNSLSFLLAFYVGYQGYSLILKPYNSGPATTVALLISTGLGSSVVKNLNRLQGVVLGTFFGNLAYALLAWCTMAGYIKVGTFIFFWLLLTLFTYYNATDFSLVACLLAAFGCQGILLGCSDAAFEPGSITHQITNTVLGVTFMSVIDQVFVLEAPSRYAKNALVDTWESYRGAMRGLFDVNVKTVRQHGGGMFAMIESASASSQMADNEPRIYKTPFRYGLYQEVMAACHELRCSLCCLEEAATATGTDDSAKADVLIAMYKLPTFKVVKNDFDKYVESVLNLYEIFLHETDEYFLDAAGIEPPKEGKSALDVAKGNIEKLVKELGTFVKQQKKQDDIAKSGSAFRSLEDDVTCKISMVVFSLNWQFDVLYGIKHRMLSD